MSKNPQQLPEVRFSRVQNTYSRGILLRILDVSGQRLYYFFLRLVSGREFLSDVFLGLGGLRRRPLDSVEVPCDDWIILLLNGRTPTPAGAAPAPPGKAHPDFAFQEYCCWQSGFSAL